VDDWQYLIVMALCVAVTIPLEFLGARVYRDPGTALRSILPVAAVFLVWDAIAIAGSVWSYNPRYVTGLDLPLDIPIEEFVFFLVIPLCALLTYSCVEALTDRWKAFVARRNTMERTS
jgi:lycopene cyclase domain-containing protein